VRFCVAPPSGKMSRKIGGKAVKSNVNPERKQAEEAKASEIEMKMNVCLGGFWAIVLAPKSIVILAQRQLKIGSWEVPTFRHFRVSQA